MKKIIANILAKGNGTSYQVNRFYNSENPKLSIWVFNSYNLGSFRFTYDNKMIWCGMIIENPFS
jgi:hypothetical protein